MGSGYYGEINMESYHNNHGSCSSGSSTRRKKKSSNTPNKPKQPQRGLGVAQLEKIRLHGQLGCSSYFPNGSISPGAPYMGHNYTHEAYGSAPLSGSPYGPNMGWNMNSSSTGYGHDSQQVQYNYSQADYMTTSYFSGQDAEETRGYNNEWGSTDTQQDVDLELRL